MEPVAGKERMGAKLVPPRVNALRRERLEAKLAGLWDHRLGLVVGPPGSGKTTLLTQFASACGAPVAWYRADGHDTSAAALLRHLGRSLSGALGGLGDDWPGVDEAVDALARWPGGRALLVVDDVHLLEGSPAESCLAWLVDDAPLSLSFLVSGRRPPRFNLSRLRLSGALLEIGADDLRFRSWEVEHLFRDFYGEVLPPEDLATLARRTEGWAAGLQLFHLATTGKPPRERRRVLHELAAGSRLVREYLARNVLDELPPETSEFLLATSVLGYLTGPLCDRLLGSTGSDEMLSALEQGQLFTAAVDDFGTYRYHEVLRSHLELVLVQRLGETEVRARYRLAGSLLEDAGMVAEALGAYARAGDDESVARLLGARGEEVLERSGAWLDELPSALTDHDPWLRVAGARRALAAGRWNVAIEGYRAAERLFGPSAAIESLRRERLALSAWLEPVVVPPVDCSGVVRSATHRDPLVAGRYAEHLGGPSGRLAEGLALLLAGSTRDAGALFDQVLADDDTAPVLALGARLASRVASSFSGHPSTAGAFEELAFEGERLGAPWLARLARGLIALTGDPQGASEAQSFREYCEANGDPWGAALAAWLEGLAELRGGTWAVKPLEEAARGFRELGAGVLETWAWAVLALAFAGEEGTEAHDAAVLGDSMARALGVRGARALTLHALAASAEPSRTDVGGPAQVIASECGLSLDAFTVPRPPLTPAPTVAAAQPVQVTCLGTFSITIGGKKVDCSSVKPRARTCLRVLAMHVDSAVHKETLVESVWPGIDPRAGQRNLHVVISTLRQLLEPGVARGASSMIMRDGDSYRLCLPPGSVSDLACFDVAISRCRAAGARGDQETEIVASREALELYAGELLPDAGPAEWVVGERERRRMDAADAAQRLAEVELARGHPAAAAVASERGIRIDRHRDSLWRLRVEAAERAGDHAGAASARRAYDGVLAELGLPPAGSADFHP